MLRTGDIAPSFTGTDQFGNELSLATLLRDGPVVLYFYPRDFTYVCTKQACLFRDEHEVLTYAGATLCGVSASSKSVQQEFSDVNNIPFPLVSDPDGSLAAKYGAGRLLGSLAKRVSFVIDQDSRIESVHHHELAVTRHLTGILDALHALGLPVAESRAIAAGGAITFDAI